MDHTRDNPLKRFTAFWVALVLVTAFGIAGIVLGPFFGGGDKEDPAYTQKSAERLGVRRQVENASEKALNREALDKALAAGSKSLLSSKPAKGARPVPAEQPADAAKDSTKDQPAK